MTLNKSYRLLVIVDGKTVKLISKSHEIVIIMNSFIFETSLELKKLDYDH